MFRMRVAPLPELVAYYIWASARYVYLFLLVISCGLFLAAVVGFHAHQQTPALRWYLPALAVLLVAGVCVLSRTSSSLIGGVAVGVFLGAVSRGIARWLSRDVVAVLQGAIYGSLFGILVVIALFLVAVVNWLTWGGWMYEHAIWSVTLAIAIFILTTVLGAVRGAFAGSRVKRVPPRGSPTLSARTAFVVSSLALLTVAGTVLAVVFLLGPQQGAPNPSIQALSGSMNSVKLEDSVAAEDTGPIRATYFTEADLRAVYTGAELGAANREYACLVIPALPAVEVVSRQTGTASSYFGRKEMQFTGSWRTGGGSTLAYRCTVSSAEPVSGWMEIDDGRRSLADGRVFLVKPGSGGRAEVQQVNAPLTGKTPQEVLKNLVKTSKEVRAFLAAHLNEAVRSGNLARRGPASLVLYRCGLAGELATPVLTESLKDERGWVRLMAARALWERERDPTAIPTLVALMQDPGQDFWVLQHTARALGDIGPEARAAIPSLRQAVSSRDGGLRQAAADALKKLEK
jgi:hypothetical protein